MLQHNQLLAALREMDSAYTHMRSRLNRIPIDRGLERSRRKLDRDLERFRFKITHLSLTLERPRRSEPF
jgi:hypothetical protein